MPKGAHTTTDLARAIELLKTRDRNRQKEIRRVRGDVASVEKLLHGGEPHEVDVTTFRSNGKEFETGLPAEPGIVARLTALEARFADAYSQPRTIGAIYVTPAEARAIEQARRGPRRGWLDRFLDRWVRG